MTMTHYWVQTLHRMAPNLEGEKDIDDPSGQRGLYSEGPQG